MVFECLPYIFNFLIYWNPQKIMSWLFNRLEAFHTFKRESTFLSNPIFFIIIIIIIIIVNFLTGNKRWTSLKFKWPVPLVFSRFFWVVQVLHDDWYHRYFYIYFFFSFFFLWSIARSCCLSIFFVFFNFPFWSTETVKSADWQMIFIV